MLAYWVQRFHSIIFQDLKQLNWNSITSLYVEYIMRNDGLDEAQAGIKIARRNINNLRYADDTTLMAERRTKEPLVKVKEESEKVGLKLNIQKT